MVIFTGDLQGSVCPREVVQAVENYGFIHPVDDLVRVN